MKKWDLFKLLVRAFCQYPEKMNIHTSSLTVPQDKLLLALKKNTGRDILCSTVYNAKDRLMLIIKITMYQKKLLCIIASGVTPNTVLGKEASCKVIHSYDITFVYTVKEFCFKRLK